MAEQTVVNAPNKIVQPYLERIMIAADRERRRGFTPYRGPRVEGMTRDQLAALQGIRSLQIPGQLRDAQNLYGRAANLAGREANYRAGAITANYDPKAVAMFGHPGTSNMFERPEDVQMFERPDNVQALDWYRGDFDSESASKYMNPYIDKVLGIAQREAERDYAKEAAGQRLNAARQGAFGGSRATIMERDMRRDHEQRMDDLYLKGMHSAYENAQGMFDRDRTARAAQAGMVLDADKFNVGTGMQYGLAGLDLGKFNAGMAMNYGQMGLQNQQFNVGTNMDYGRAGLQNAQFNEGQRLASSDLRLRQQIAHEQAQLAAAGHRLGAINSMTPMAQGIADIGRMRFGMTMDKYNALNQMGEQQRLINQSALDTAYNEYLRQQNWGRDSIGWQTGIISGMPMGMNSYSYNSSYTPQPSNNASNLVGAMASGLGAYGMMRR